LLESTGEVTVAAAVGSAVELLDAVERLQPDAVITDIRMPPTHHMEGIEAAHTVRARHPEIGVVVLSQHADEGYAFELLQHGTAGFAYLLKERIGDGPNCCGPCVKRSPGVLCSIQLLWMRSWVGALGKRTHPYAS
jgi:CheY-like chemotaxis protein